MKKYYILAFTFLCLLKGQNNYGQTSGGDYGWEIDLEDVCVNCPDEDDYCTECACDSFYCWDDDDYGDNGSTDDDYEDPCPSGDSCECYGVGCDNNSNNNNSNPDPVQTPIPDVTVKCISDIKDELRALTQSNFSNILDKFGSNSPYKVNISIGSLGESMDLARTQNGAVYRTYDIVFNLNYSKVTSLSIVTSLIHEYIHAYFKTLYDDFINNNNTHAYDQFPVLKEYYTDTTYVGTIQDAHHEQMANTYIDIIAATIQEFQTGNPVSVGNADQLYKDMAWSSFDGTPVFYNTLVQPDIDRIRSQRAAETYNAARGTSTPKGTSCK